MKTCSNRVLSWLAVGLLASNLSACAVVSVAGAAVSVAGAVVNTGVAVGSAAVSVGATVVKGAANAVSSTRQEGDKAEDENANK